MGAGVRAASWGTPGVYLRRPGGAGRDDGGQTAKCLRLVAFALNALGASEDDGGGVSFSDSFGVVRYLPHQHGLVNAEGQVLSTQEDVRNDLCRPPGCNAEGLLSGTVLTLFGALKFGVSLFVREQYGERQESMRAILTREHPFVHRSAQYTSLNISMMERHVGWVITGVQVGRGGRVEIGHEAPDGIQADGAATQKQVMAALFTPASRHAARSAEIEQRRSRAEQVAAETAHALKVIEEEARLHQLTRPLTR